jgi:hypothetical protein
MATQTLELEDLVRLIDDLRLAGYDVGTQQYINAQRLLLALAAHGRHPERPQDLRPLLAPLFCSSPREQESFYEYFPRWLALQPHLAPAEDGGRAGPRPAPPRVVERWRETVWPRLRRRALPLSVVAALLLAALAAYLLAPLWPRTLYGAVVNVDNSPLPGAKIVFTGQSAAEGDVPSFVEADAEGNFSYTYRRRNAPTGLVASHDGYADEQQPLDVSNLRLPLTITLQRPAPPPTPTPKPVEREDAEVTKREARRPQASTPTPTPIPTPTPLEFAIGGSVSEDGRGMSGVKVMLSSRYGNTAEGGPALTVVDTALTDASGRYSFAGLPAGILYSVGASKADYTFSPSSHFFFSLNSDQTADFSAARAAALDFGLLRLVAVGLPLALFAAWWLWRRHRHRRMLMRKNRSALPPRLEHLTVKGAAEQLFQGQAFRRAAQELRRHRRRVSHDLDERVTIEATVRRGGLFTPFYGSRKTLPEYLALVERVAPGDQQARFQEELVRRLVQDSVIVDQYYFRGDPRICRRKDDGAPRPATYVTLPDLAALHPDYYLLVFSDGAGFVNRVTGEPEGWVEQFAQWPGRALLTPQPPAQWRSRERALQESDFLVLPLGRDGLEALGEAINTGEPPDLTRRGAGRARPFPELLRDRPRLWLEDHEPTTAKAARLAEQLRDYLGADGMNWLAACAVYPALHWDLTLYLGSELTEDREEFERKLLALVSLPWLRYGVMPDWLRTRLITTLTPEAERAVRGALERLLLSVLDPPPDGVRLDYSTRRKVTPPRGPKGLWLRLREYLRGRGRRRTLRELFRTEEDDSPLKDFVFLTFMSGRRPRRLDFNVPDLLRRILFPGGQRSFGLRPTTALACALLLSFGGWTAASVLEPDLGAAPVNVDISWLKPVMIPPAVEETPSASPTPTATPSGRCADLPAVSVNGGNYITEGDIATFGVNVAAPGTARESTFTWDVRDETGKQPEFDIHNEDETESLIDVTTTGLGGRTLTASVYADLAAFGKPGCTAHATGRTIVLRDSGDIGVPECDDFLNRYKDCLIGAFSLNPPIFSKELALQAVLRGQWQAVATTPQGRAGLAQTCKQMRETTKRRMAAYGCDWGSTTQPTPTPTATSTPGPSPRPSPVPRDVTNISPPEPAPLPAPVQTTPITVSSLRVIFHTTTDAKDVGDAVRVVVYLNGDKIGDSGPRDADKRYEKKTITPLDISLDTPIRADECKSLEIVVYKQVTGADRGKHVWDVQVEVEARTSGGRYSVLLEKTETWRLGVVGNALSVQSGVKCPAP